MEFESIGNEIRKARMKHNITKQEVLKKLRCSESQYIDLEVGLIRMSKEQIKVVSGMTGISETTLLKAYHYI